MTNPIWFDSARAEIGQHELPENRGPVVQKYIDLAHCGEQGDPWCAIFVNAMLEKNGVPGTRSPSSQSFRHNSHFVKLAEPTLGAIVVFWRMNPQSGLGHVGFYAGESQGFIATLGGNESDAVRVENLAKRAGHFGLVGYYWPASIPVSETGSVSASAATGGKVT